MAGLTGKVWQVWEWLSAEAGRQHGTSHHQLLPGEKEGRTMMSFFKMPQHGANPAPADISSTRSQCSSGSTWICMLWNTSRRPVRSPSPPEWQKCAALNLPAEFQVAPTELTLHSTEFKASKFFLEDPIISPTQSWISVSTAWLELTSLLAGHSHAASCSTCLQNYC